MKDLVPLKNKKVYICFSLQRRDMLLLKLTLIKDLTFLVGDSMQQMRVFYQQNIII